MNIEKNPVLSQTTEMVVGKTKYIVTSHFKKDGRETAEQKLMRLVTERISDGMEGEKLPSLLTN
ncbi:hypothetical protein FACS1894132_11490 [Clostridia bacterium]|nr:hypothetical protein FACS1894132_11490 [Clostridia bacterium]